MAILSRDLKDGLPEARDRVATNGVCAYRKCYPGANAFKISDLQEAENGSIASQAIRM
jgi:hypothetical protein